MLFKAKLRKIGNSLCVITPKEVIDFIEGEWKCPLKAGDELTFEVITEDEEYYDLPCGVITESTKQPTVITEKVITNDKDVITEKVVPKHWVFNETKGINEFK